MHPKQYYANCTGSEYINDFELSYIGYLLLFVTLYDSLFFQPIRLLQDL